MAVELTVSGETTARTALKSAERLDYPGTLVYCDSQLPELVGVTV